MNAFAGVLKEEEVVVRDGMECLLLADNCILVKVWKDDDDDNELFDLTKHLSLTECFDVFVLDASWTGFEFS